MADLSIVKSNVAKMVSMGAPESDIDEYIQGEGTTVDAIRNFTSLPSTTSNRFLLKSEQPYSSYSYTDALKDTGKTVVNSFANIGDAVMEPIKHPIKTVGNIIGGVGQAVFHPVDTAKGVAENLTSTNNPDNVPNWAYGIHTDPLAFAGTVVGAGAVAKELPRAANLVKGGAKNVGNFFNFDRKSLDLAKNIRTVAAKAKQGAVDKFGDSIDVLAKANPNQTVSLDAVINDIQQNMSTMPVEAQSVFRKVPILRDMLKPPGTPGHISPSNVSLKDTQEIINYINTKIPRNIKSNSLDILDAQNDIRAAQLYAFQEMASVRQEYGQFANDYNLVKGSLRPGSTVNAIRSNFNGNVEIKDAAKRIFSNSDVLGTASKYRGQMATVNFLKKVLTLGVAKEGGWRVLQK